MKYATENQASVATWLASSSVVDTLLSESTTTSSKATTTPAKVAPKPPASNSNAGLTKVTTSKGVIYATVAKNPTTREQGLGGYTSLGADKGMLFIFPKSGQQNFWMKDMNFPIDIVWINSGMKIIGVESDVSPNSYPKVYSSPVSTQFVIEVNAGFAEKLGLIVGTRVIF